MHLAPNVFDVWALQRRADGVVDGLRSVHEYVTAVKEPAKELCLFEAS